MRIEVLHFTDCPNGRPAIELVRRVAAEHGLESCVRDVEVQSLGEAVRLRFLGSPTVLIDGLDVDPAARHRTDFAMVCRLYGSSGLPSAEMIAEALREARARNP